MDNLTFFIDYFTKLAIDFAFMYMLISVLYCRTYKSREYIFSFFIFNLIIFSLTYLLNKFEISMGAAFGFFAVFSMLRYRTEGLSMKDMTYLFLSIAMGLINGISHGYLIEIVVLNAMVIFLTYILESNFIFRKEYSKIVQYDVVENLHFEKLEILKVDLEARLGISINRVTIESIDFLRDSAMLKIYYFEKEY